MCTQLGQLPTYPPTLPWRSSPELALAGRDSFGFGGGGGVWAVAKLHEGMELEIALRSSGGYGRISAPCVGYYVSFNTPSRFVCTAREYALLAILEPLPRLEISG